jgi:hypothetical protein
MSHHEIPPPIARVPVSTEVAQGSTSEPHRYDRLLDLVPEGCLLSYLTRKRHWYHAGPGELRRSWHREDSSLDRDGSGDRSAVDRCRDDGELLVPREDQGSVRPGWSDPGASPVSHRNDLRVDGESAKRVKCFMNPEGL